MNVDVNEVAVKVDEVMSENPRYRKGQTIFNVLCVLHPTVAGLLRGGPLDPYYWESDDTRFDDLWAWLETTEFE